MIRAGMVGFSDKNGHPFSFAAIINGYESHRIREAGWSVIADYLDLQKIEDFGVDDMRVTSAWSDNPALTQLLADACLISDQATSLENLASSVDAVIIARDDYSRHRELASVSLGRGLPTFVDKPLSLDPGDLEYFLPFLRRGQLMSCSGTRFSDGLVRLRERIDGRVDQIVRVDSVTPQSWDRYGVHILEAISTFVSLDQLDVSAFRTAETTHAMLTNDRGQAIHVSALGSSATHPISIAVTTRHGTFYEQLTDNFIMFRGALRAFHRMIETGQPPIDPETTHGILKAASAIEVAAATTASSPSGESTID